MGLPLPYTTTFRSQLRLVRHEAGDNLVQVLAANAAGLGGFWFGEALDLDLENAALLMEADIALVWLVAAFAIVETGCGGAGGRVLRLELEARGQDLLHKQTGGDSFERIRSEEHTSELQSLMRISYAVFCLKKK